MRYWKAIYDGYIRAIGIGSKFEEIQKVEYDQIKAVVDNRPPKTDKMDYLLRADLTWEAYEVEPAEPEDEEIPTDEALAIILGGAT